MLSTRFHSFGSLTTLYRAFFTSTKYTKSHEWIKLNGRIATIGITDFAQRELGEIILIKLPKTDTEIQRGGIVSKIETNKTVANVCCPFKGKIIEINQLLKSNKNLLKKSPKCDGWIVKIKIEEDEADKEMEKLLTEEQYKQHI